MSFIGIDFGGSFIKSAILDVNTVEVQHIRRVPFPAFEAGHINQRTVSSEILLKIVRMLLEDLLSQVSTCEGILFCGQMHALVFCDAHGLPKSNIITWQDQRTLAIDPKSGKTYFALLQEELQYWDPRILGNELRPGVPLSQLFYLRQRNELPAGLYPASLMDFVVANLCKTAPVTDATNAEAHGIYNLMEGIWDYRLIEKLGLADLAWQKIEPQFSICGMFVYNQKEIPCFLPIGDQQCALLGSFLEEHELSLNIATGSQVSLLTNNHELGDYQTRPYFEELYLKTITHIPGGRALNALIKLLTELSPIPTDDLDSVWAYIDSQVERIRSTNLKVNISFYSGTLGDSGHILNLQENNMNVGNLFYAAFENMALNYHRCALRLSPSRNWHKLIFSGGLINKHPALQKSILKAFDHPEVRINDAKEDVIIGLLIIATKISKQLSLANAMHLVRSSVSVKDH